MARRRDRLYQPDTFERLAQREASLAATRRGERFARVAADAPQDRVWALPPMQEVSWMGVDWAREEFARPDGFIQFQATTNQAPASSFTLADIARAMERMHLQVDQTFYVGNADMMPGMAPPAMLGSLGDSSDYEKPSARAAALLREWLSEAQRAQLNEFGYFDVIGSESGKTYRLHRYASFNVEELATGDRLCFSPRPFYEHPESMIAYLPHEDLRLGQKIALETDEPAALAVANRRRDLYSVFGGPVVNHAPRGLMENVNH